MFTLGMEPTVTTNVGTEKQVIQHDPVFKYDVTGIDNRDCVQYQIMMMDKTHWSVLDCIGNLDRNRRTLRLIRLRLVGLLWRSGRHVDDRLAPSGRRRRCTRKPSRSAAKPRSGWPLGRLRLNERRDQRLTVRPAKVADLSLRKA